MLRYHLKRCLRKLKWRKLNRHNFTYYDEIFGDMRKIHIGRYTYGGIYVSASSNDNELFIGDFCSIAGEVRFLLGADHDINRISLYPFKSNILRTGIDAISKGNIIVDDDVWLGQGVIVLSGVHIGQGAVIAAGAVVTKDVPPYAIVGGVPAKVIKYRFESEIVEELLKIDYRRLTDEMIKEHIDELYTDLKSVKQIKWFPQREEKNFDRK